MLGIIPSIIGGVTSVIDKLVPDPEEKQRLKAELEKALLSADMERELQRYAVMIAEAESEDKWTSRARPSFLYVVYVLLLASIPYSVLYAFSPMDAMGIAAGMKAWFDAIPGELYALMGAGYLGYTTMREVGKGRVKKK